MLQTSEQTDKIDQALAKAQGEFPVVERDSQNPHYKSTYASLAAIWSAVRPALAKHGVSITQHPSDSETPGRLVLQTRIACEGQWMLSTCSVPLAKQDVQGWGAALTYAKRYALTAIIGLADDDDDGEGAVDRTQDTKPPATASAPQRAISKPQSGLTPAQQVTKIMNERQLNPGIVGRWLRARYPKMEYKSMPQAMSTEIQKVFAQATDQSLEEELAKLEGP